MLASQVVGRGYPFGFLYRANLFFIGHPYAVWDAQLRGTKGVIPSLDLLAEGHFVSTRFCSTVVPKPGRRVQRGIYPSWAVTKYMSLIGVRMGHWSYKCWWATVRLARSDCYRIRRQLGGYPSRGQRTRSNSISCLTTRTLTERALRMFFAGTYRVRPGEKKVFMESESLGRYRMELLYLDWGYAHYGSGIRVLLFSR